MHYFCFSNHDLHKILGYLNMLQMPEEGQTGEQFERKYMLELLVSVGRRYEPRHEISNNLTF